jgi:hypothetical protein
MLKGTVVSNHAVLALVEELDSNRSDNLAKSAVAELRRLSTLNNELVKAMTEVLDKSAA